MNSDNKNPLITVIIPVYNCEKTISNAIDSIINQTYKNLEIIVVDDSSTDATKNIVTDIMKRESRLKLFSAPSDPFRFDHKLNRNINAGYSARNIGFDNTKGEYITFQDADDASLLNRIEVQYNLLLKYKATHVTLDWIQYDDKYLGKKLDLNFFSEINMLNPIEIFETSQRSKGFISKISRSLNQSIPFHVKRKRIINKLFFGSLENYLGAGNSPLFKREVIDRVRFRSLKDRIWPSFMGRGADKDFNFQVAETFKNSYIFFIPLYMWRVDKQNPRYESGLDKFIS